MSKVQTDLFDTEQAVSVKSVKKRDVNAEAKRMLDKAGISTLPKEAKEYVLAELIARYFPELEKVIQLSQIAFMSTQANVHGRHNAEQEA
jgi:hypothetical protein